MFNGLALSASYVFWAKVKPPITATYSVISVCQAIQEVRNMERRKNLFDNFEIGRNTALFLAVDMFSCAKLSLSRGYLSNLYPIKD
jgi:hypothetical protein